MTVRHGFRQTAPHDIRYQPLTPTQQRAHTKELKRTTTCDLCGGKLIVFDIVDGAETRWTHADPFLGMFHRPVPANMNGD